MKHKLTPVLVAKPPLPGPGRDRITYWEGNFGLIVTAEGHKSFVVQYGAGKVSRRMSLKHGLSLQEARREAKAILGAGDPLGERRKAAGETLKSVADDYLKREAGKLQTGNKREPTLRRRWKASARRLPSLLCRPRPRLPLPAALLCSRASLARCPRPETGGDG
jgi:hypothetical protein